LRAARQAPSQRPARGHDHVDIRIIFLGDVRELDSVHAAGKCDVGHQQDEAAAIMLQHQFSGFRAFALDHVVIALFQQHADHLALHRVILDDQGCGSKRLRLSHE